MTRYFLKITQGGSLANGTAIYGRDDVDSVIVVCFDYGTTDIKELVKSHKAKSRKIMDTIEERLVNMVTFDVDVDEVTDSGIACTVQIPSGPLDVSVYVIATFYADVTKGKKMLCCWGMKSEISKEDWIVQPTVHWCRK